MKYIITITAFILCLNITAQDNIIPLWKLNNLPNHKMVNSKELSTGTSSQIPYIQPIVPYKRDANGEGILVCPGGGYTSFDWYWISVEIAKWLNSRGIAAFVLRYRLPQSTSVITSYKAPLQDAQRAMRWIRYNAKQYNVNINKVGVLGSSAGGHLASTLGNHYNMPVYDKKDAIDKLSARPDFMMLIYPVISMKKGITHLGSRYHLLGHNPSDNLVNEFSNELHVTKDTPPTFIAQASNDSIAPVENSILMYRALVKNKISVEMHLFPTGGHGFGLGLGPHGPDWRPLAEKWMDSLNK